MASGCGLKVAVTTGSTVFTKLYTSICLIEIKGNACSIALYGFLKVPYCL